MREKPYLHEASGFNTYFRLETSLHMMFSELNPTPGGVAVLLLQVMAARDGL